jgi:hypothetical protein
VRVNKIAVSQLPITKLNIIRHYVSLKIQLEIFAIVRLCYNYVVRFEGLCQKDWTLVTIAMLLLVEYRSGLKSYRVGQGDIYICRLHQPKIDPTLSTSECLRAHSSDVNKHNSCHDFTEGRQRMKASQLTLQFPETKSPRPRRPANTQ